MKIEAVVICKDYGDFLSHTLPENMQHLDRIVVVTHPDDRNTRRICDQYGVEYLDTKLFHEDGDKFNKGRAINLGLSHLRHEDWLLHIDADVVLPHRFRNLLERAKLNPLNLYGADRLNIPSYEAWMKHKPSMATQYAWKFLVTAAEGFNIGSRLLHHDYGYCPIGYFQLWHSTAHRKYPMINGSAEHSDVMFAVQWARENRILLPEFFVYHLESEKAEMGINWGGRKSKPFGPPKSYSR